MATTYQLITHRSFNRIDAHPFLDALVNDLLNVGLGSHQDGSPIRLLEDDVHLRAYILQDSVRDIYARIIEQIFQLIFVQRLV